MAPRHDEQVYRGVGVDVAKDDHFLVLVDELRVRAAADDPAEDAIRFHLFRP